MPVTVDKVFVTFVFELNVFLSRVDREDWLLFFLFVLFVLFVLSMLFIVRWFFLPFHVYCELVESCIFKIFTFHVEILSEVSSGSKNTSYHVVVEREWMMLGCFFQLLCIVLISVDYVHDDGFFCG